jgi:hypothetical protein
MQQSDILLRYKGYNRNYKEYVHGLMDNVWKRLALNVQIRMLAKQIGDIIVLRK